MLFNQRILLKTTPLIFLEKENNGIIACVKDDNAQLRESNIITVDMFKKSFYQFIPYHFITHERINILKSINLISEYSMHFITVDIRYVSSQKYKYNEIFIGKKLLRGLMHNYLSGVSER